MRPLGGGATEFGAISSGVERHVDIVEVAGSKPASPTRLLRSDELIGAAGSRFDKTRSVLDARCAPRRGEDRRKAIRIKPASPTRFLPKALLCGNKTPDSSEKFGILPVVSCTLAI